MSLTNQQYNDITREYERIRLQNLHEMDKRTEEIYKEIPRIKQLHEEIASMSVNEVRLRLSGEGSTAAGKSASKKAIAALSAEKQQLLKEHGYPADYLTLKYNCQDCKDTGYVDGTMCSCMRSRVIDILYDQSNIKLLLEKENFSTFCTDYYSDADVDEGTGLTAHANILKALNTCHDFADNFKETTTNLFIYGNAGVGKTFLINCIAKELMDKSFSVIYVSAIQFFDILANASFHRKENADSPNMAQRDFYQCDLLIIDDLGTELSNTFTGSALFNCINERALRKKPVIISTNLQLTNLRDLYSDRVFSRIASNYTLLKIFGKDLRISKTLH